MGRLSAYAKNRILKLRFKKNKRIIHIVDILKRDDNIKVSRQAVSTFLKKYLETNSIYDKPRTGRKRKLTQEEIQLIGQVTRLNRDITARAIKEYLNLNVSTYTILRATKLFEWNKVNPNSNDSKKAAAMERDGKPSRSSSATRTTRKYTKRKSTAANSSVNNENEEDELNNQALTDLSMNNEEDEIEKIQLKPLTNQEMNKKLAAAAAAAAAGLTLDSETVTNENENVNTVSNPPVRQRNSANAIPDFEKVDMNIIPHRDLLILKNLSCSPMSFATKILFKIFKIEELHGHNVSGKTLNKNLKSKLPLDPVRIGYIKFLVEKYYDEKECKEMLHGATSTKQDLWKSCHTAINKSILISERKAAQAQAGIQNGSRNKSRLNSESGGDNSNDSKNKLNDASTNESLGESDSELPKKFYNANNSLNKKQAKNMNNQKRRRRSYSSSSSTSSSGGDFDENLMSEEFDSEDQSDQDGEDEELEINPIKSNQRRPKRQKKKNNFSFQGSGSEEDGDEFANEIELIQNIENRLVNPAQVNNKKKDTELNEKQKVKPEEASVKEKEESSEASAAANIAAMMKKRFVVVAPVEQTPTPASTTTPEVNKQSNGKTASSKKSPPQRLTRLKQVNTSSSEAQTAVEKKIEQIEIKKEKETPNEPVLVMQQETSKTTKSNVQTRANSKKGEVSQEEKSKEKDKEESTTNTTGTHTMATRRSTRSSAGVNKSFNKK